jgi:shikimate dehydrogenase
VWGSPVSHSLSPALHTAAYQALGIDARYGYREVTEASLEKELETLTVDFRGLSLTMPLKEAILPLVSDHRGLVDELGAANTVVRDSTGSYLWNTDPAGVLGALADASLPSLDRALVLGAGATARSVLCALGRLGISSVVVASRDEARSEQTLSYATTLGMHVGWCTLGELQQHPADLVVSTLPHGVNLAPEVPQSLVDSAALFDVTYHPWPSPLAERWSNSTHPVISGASMLLHQAVAQIRLFVGGDAERALPAEEKVMSAMRRALP